MDFINLKNIISANNSFLLTTHVNPDADAIGSEIAMYSVLRKIGKEVHIINHSTTPYNLVFLDPDHVIRKYDDDRDRNILTSVDVIVALDYNRPERIVSMLEAFNASKKIKVCIDHHQDPAEFADYYFVDDKYSATGHILYHFIKSTNIVELDYNISYPLYAAIMTDTGSFRFNRTTPELHIIIADLLSMGVDPSEVYDKIYGRSNFSKTKLLGKALSSLKIINNQIGYMYISQNDFKELGAIISDTENFVNYTLSIENVVIGLLFIELKNGFKVSFRSKGDIPVNKLASLYGGGGHINASGARFHDVKLADEYSKILFATEYFLNDYLQGKNV
jgi:phosphoesterase RecJ-like protein